MLCEKLTEKLKEKGHLQLIYICLVKIIQLRVENHALTKLTPILDFLTYKFPN